MARIDCYSAESFYFCGVKNQMRHEVAGSASVFRAHNLVEKLYPNECGSSNARKGSAFGTLTARIGVLLCQKIMEINAKKLQDAQQKVVESIQEYLNDFHSVGDLYRRAAKAMAALTANNPKLATEDKRLINDMVQDYICILDLIEPLEEKGGEV